MEVTPERYPISAKLELVREEAQAIQKFLNWANKGQEYAFGEKTHYDHGNGCDHGHHNQCDDSPTYIHGDYVVDIGEGTGSMISQEAILKYYDIDLSAWNIEQERIRADIQIALRMEGALLCGKKAERPAVTGKPEKVTCTECAMNLMEGGLRAKVRKPSVAKAAQKVAKTHLGVGGKAICGIESAHKFTDNTEEVTCGLCTMEGQSWEQIGETSASSPL